MKKPHRIIAAAAITLFVALLAYFNIYNNEVMTAEYRKITAEEAKAMLEANADAILLDVRTEEEFTERHIPGAVLLPDYEVAEKAAEVLPDKNALILVYCRTGRRSANAANELIEMGYTNVYDFGGINDWPYETS
jgi:rhodanese-related sulfurtransferase